MKRGHKICLIISAMLIAVGGILFTGAMSALDWEFAALTTSTYERHEYTVAEAFCDVRIVTDTADVRILPAADGVARVELYEEASAKHRVSVEDGVLLVEVDDPREWYQHIGIGFDTPRVCVYLPEEALGTLTAETDTGDIWLTHVAATEVSIRVSTGDVRLEHTTATDASIRVSTGDVVLAETSCESLLTAGSTGDLSFTDVTVEGHLAIERSTGDVRLSRCDAATVEIATGTGDVTLSQCDADTIEIVTDTGDVTGTLLTEKTFSAHSGTGDVEVPKNTVGGVCRITTDTGDIQIEIVP